MSKKPSLALATCGLCVRQQQEEKEKDYEDYVQRQVWYSALTTQDMDLINKERSWKLSVEDVSLTY